MSLVDYGSSDESSQDGQPKIAAKSKISTGKPAFQKLVDSSNPHTIRVSLEPTRSENHGGGAEIEPPAKRARIGGGGLTDFNALLPAPKRTANANGNGRSGGLGRGVNLKTGTTPGFTREPMPEYEHGPERRELTDGRADHKSLEEHGDAGVLGADATRSSPANEQPERKATVFKPLSVSRKPQKKKPPLSTQSDDSKLSQTSAVSGTTSTMQASKVSLFSTAAPGNDDLQRKEPKGTYQPMLYQPTSIHPTPSSSHTPPDQAQTDEAIAVPHFETNDSGPDQSLDAIADSLNLTASQKRQLLGRNASKASSRAIKVTNFNTDAEYAANEALRQAGETVQHQPVRAIAGGGKHSLKQLVSSAMGQKDALEESFAEGRRSRKEGAGRYGW